MIFSLKGKLTKKSPVLVNLSLIAGLSEVEFEIHIPVSTYEKLPECGNEVRLYIYPYFYKGEALLYGFISEEDRTMFRELLKLPGVGPGLALRVLSGTTAEELLKAVSEGNLDLLASIRGIGRKRAERIAFELGGKIPSLREKIREESKAEESREKALEALLALGLKEKEAKEALKRASKKIEEGAPLEEIIKTALSRKAENEDN